MSELHTEIIDLATANESGQYSFSSEAERKLRIRFTEVLTAPGFEEAVGSFVRAVAAFHKAGQPGAAQRLMEIGTEVVEEISQSAALPAEKLKAAMTGATDLANLAPVGSKPAPKGAFKATAFIRPLPKQR